MSKQPPPHVLPTDGWSSEMPNIVWRSAISPEYPTLFEELAVMSQPTPKRIALFVNGLPRAGKDTFCEFAAEILTAHRVAVGTVSSIDGVRELLGKHFDVADKTPEMRALLSEVGASVEKFNGFRSRACVRAGAELVSLNPNHPACLFVHCREPEVIACIAQGLSELGFVSVHVRVTGNREQHINSNASDLGAANTRADFTIENNGTLADLRGLSQLFASRIFQNSVPIPAPAPAAPPAVEGGQFDFYLISKGVGTDVSWIARQLIRGIQTMTFDVLDADQQAEFIQTLLEKCLVDSTATWQKVAELLAAQSKTAAQPPKD